MDEEEVIMDEVITNKEPKRLINEKFLAELGFEEAEQGLWRKDAGETRQYVDFRLNKKDGSPVNKPDTMNGRRYAFIGDSMVKHIDTNCVDLKAYREKSMGVKITADGEAVFDKPKEENAVQETLTPEVVKQDQILVKKKQVFQKELQETKQILSVGTGDMVMPAVSPLQFKQNLNLFINLRNSIAEPLDIQVIGGKNYMKKSFWRKVGLAFNLTDKIVKEERSQYPDGFVWKIVAEASAPNGRTSTGVGICDSRERKFAHPEHDVYATAHTRAKNRAISDLVGNGECSAEELE